LLLALEARAALTEADQRPMAGLLGFRRPDLHQHQALKVSLLLAAADPFP
jgi:hypothetical protein